jgi:hypothetical protein
MEQTRSALTDKLEMIEQRVTHRIDGVKEKIQNVKRTFDLPHQVRQHPWPMFGASVAAGMVLASLTAGPVKRALAAGSPGAASAGNEHDFYAEVPSKSRGNGIFAEELRYIQRAAVGTVMSLLRDSVVKAFPSIAVQADHVIDGLTRKLGGEPVQEVSRSRPE